MKPLNLAKLKHRKLFSKSNEELSSTAVLSEILSLKDIFIHHEIIPPGKRTSLPHFHTKKEEVLIVLEGAPTAVLGGVATKMKQGDFVGYLPNKGVSHFVKNDSTKPAKILVVTSNPAGDKIIFARS